jgi:hypothetical protein
MVWSQQYLALYVIPSAPERLRVVLQSVLYDGCSPGDSLMFCQGVTCQSDVQLTTLENAVEELNMRTVLPAICRAAEGTDAEWNRELYGIVRQTIVDAHALALEYPWCIE